MLQGGVDDAVLDCISPSEGGLCRNVFLAAGKGTAVLSAAAGGATGGAAIGGTTVLQSVGGGATRRGISAAWRDGGAANQSRRAAGEIDLAVLLHTICRWAAVQAIGGASPCWDLSFVFFSG